jgi:hypothetical protein
MSTDSLQEINSHGTHFDNIVNSSAFEFYQETPFHLISHGRAE